jgi:hypothetical protein
MCSRCGTCRLIEATSVIDLCGAGQTSDRRRLPLAGRCVAQPIPGIQDQYYSLSGRADPLPSDAAVSGYLSTADAWLGDGATVHAPKRTVDARNAAMAEHWKAEQGAVIYIMCLRCIIRVTGFIAKDPLCKMLRT